jgi:ubiquinone/menaquinone biosynthesis C-methylase UbiE
MFHAGADRAVRHRPVDADPGEMSKPAIADSKQAEKDYLRRSAGGDWEASKPFPPEGQRATDEHAQHLLDFAVLLRVLTPTPADVVLDLGAGSCWVSDWLRRCTVQTVAVDIAVDMLRLGAARMGSTRGLVAGDLEHLPFADSAIAKACCLNALHHLPNAAAAVGEIRRVLKPDGVVFFSEPGVGHASHPTSIAASRNYGVLENEVHISSLMDLCRAAGFAEVRLHPISHIVPLFDLTQQQWRDWTAFTASKRPARALQKLWRAVLEVVGLGKKGILFEEAFAIRLLRELQPVIEQHPIVTAHCAPFVKPSSLLESAAFEGVSVPATARAGSDVVIRVRVRNAGTTDWSTSAVAGEVRLGVQLLAPDGRVLDRDYARRDLPAPILPGGRCELTLTVAAPPAPGSYHLKFDLVREGVRWFELAGSRPVIHPIHVTE